MIRNKLSGIKRSMRLDLLIVSDQILISVIDGVVALVFIIIGLALVIGERPKLLGIVGIVLIALAGVYSLLKNVGFRSVGCIVKNGMYILEKTKRKASLKFRILIHNAVSISPFMGLLLYRKLPYVFYFVVLIYMLNFVGYKMDSKRVIDSWLKLAVVTKRLNK